MKELELILQAMTQLGAAGKEAFFWWLFFDKGLTFLVVAFTALLAFLAISRGIRAGNRLEDLEHLRNQMGVGSRGSFVTSEDVAAMRKWIEERAK